jgi:hypothetical protein
MTKEQKQELKLWFYAASAAMMLAFIFGFTLGYALG